jgi:peptidase YpeB-like protein
VTIGQARSIALKAGPGTIKSEELEKEKGGSGLRYSFGIKNGNATYEVGVDAQSGDVLENTKKAPTRTRTRVIRSGRQACEPRAPRPNALYGGQRYCGR